MENCHSCVLISIHRYLSLQFHPLALTDLINCCVQFRLPFVCVLILLFIYLFLDQTCSNCHVVSECVWFTCFPLYYKTNWIP